METLLVYSMPEIEDMDQMSLAAAWTSVETL